MKLTIPGENSILLRGRLQSRVYTKVLDGRTEERTAFEVSVMRLPEEYEDEL